LSVAIRIGTDLERTIMWHCAQAGARHHQRRASYRRGKDPHARSPIGSIVSQVPGTAGASAESAKWHRALPGAHEVARATGPVAKFRTVERGERGGIRMMRSLFGMYEGAEQSGKVDGRV
jgi:hypothetical protein